MKDILTAFQSPDIAARGMFRSWFPDAGADLELVEKQVRSVYEGGFGGMEIAMVPQYVDFDPAEYGWATPRWKEILRRVLRTADSLPEPFEIDLTITAHWPPALNTIDPNHPAAQKELRCAVEKIVSGGVLPLPMPLTRTCDDDAQDAAHFIFTDTFLCAVKAKIVGKKADKYILATDSMTDVSAFVRDTGKTTPAGIALDEDKYGDKPRLADAQHYYEIDLDAAGIPASGEGAWQAGDWLLFAFYTRGTGQSLSGRSMPMFHLQLPMAGKMYATDYYCTEGTDAIIDVWQKNILDDAEIRALMRKNPGAIFEDSIELSCATIPWTNRFAQEFKALRGYDILPMLPILQSLKGAKHRFLTDTGIEHGLVDDFYVTLNDLYLRDHVGRLTEWAHSLGWQYRAQSYGGDVNTAAASVVLDVAEGESLGFGEMREYFRNLSGGVHMTGRKFLSDEVLADLMAGYCLDWKSACGTLNSNWAAGVNRMVIHGMSYAAEVSGKYSQWPGWHAFQNAFADPWGDRQPYWEHVRAFADFLARTQAVLQGGTPKLDLAVYKAERAYGWGYTALLDRGYSYDVISNPHLFLPEAAVRGGVLCPDGPAYQALVLCNQRTVPAASAKRLLELAQAGLPVLLVGCVPEADTGAKPESGVVAAAMQAMTALPNVLICESLEQAAELLRSLGIASRADYTARGVESLCREDESGRYYFFYNGAEVQTLSVTLRGSGVPVLLNAYTGAITPLPFEKAEGGVRVSLRLAKRDAALIALLPEAAKAARRVEDAPIALTEFDTAIESWGPDPSAPVPTMAKKTALRFGKQPPCLWDALPATQGQLDALEVDGMNHVSGRGVYRTTFTLAACDGAVLTVDPGDGMVVAGQINGRPLPMVNQRTGQVDLTGLAQTGDNTLELVLATTLINRLRIANPLFDGKGGMPAPPSAPDGEDGAPMMGNAPDEDYELPTAPMDMPEPRPSEYHYGLRSAFITPYFVG